MATLPDQTPNPTPQELADNEAAYLQACELLTEMLKTKDSNGYVSLRGLKSEIMKAFGGNVPLVSSVLTKLKDDDKNWIYQPCSFYTPEAWKIEEKRLAAEAEKAEKAAPKEEEQEESTAKKTNTYKQEERRLTSGYVVPFLKDLYDSEYLPDDVEEYVFDVQSARPSSDFRNVDAIAVDFRSEENDVELVAIEVKMSFTSHAVQQAANYRRFSHRVWLAVGVESGIDPTSVAKSLREQDPLLFDYAVALGIGMIACQRKQGNGYKCFVLQWPNRLTPCVYEQKQFMRDYAEYFEKVGIVEKRRKVLARVA